MKWAVLLPKIGRAVCLALFCCTSISNSALAQVTIGQGGLFVRQGTFFSVGRMELDLALDYTFSGTTINRSATPVSINGVPSIGQVYTFAEPIVYSGTVRFFYSPSTLNGADASELKLIHAAVENGPLVAEAGTVVNTVNQYVEFHFDEPTTLQLISAVTSLNDRPVGVDDTVTVTEDVPATGNVLTNDTDVDGDALTASLVTAPVNGEVELDADGSFTYTPNANFHGLDSLQYQVCDNGVPSLCDSAMVRFTVTPVNDEPTISGTPATSVNQDAAYSFIPTADDIDGDVLTFSIVNQPDWADFDAATGELSGTPGNGDVGVTTGIVITVSDGTLSADLPAFDLQVVNVNDAPTISGTPATSVNQDVAYSFIPTADDIDGDVLTFSIVNQPTWADFDAATGELSGTPGNGDVGVTTGIVITVSDGTLSADLPAFDLQVVNVNDAPTISGVPATTVNQDVAYSFTPNANDIDGDVLTFSIVNQPTWADFDAATGELSGTPGNGDVGTTTGIVITVSDGVLTASLPAFDLEVVNVNDAPTISGVPTTSVNQDAVYSFTPNANDIDGDVLTFSIVNQPTWADFDAATGELSGTPGNGDVGTTAGIVISVSDGTLSDSLPAFDLEVVNVNDRPVAVDDAVTVTEDVPATGNVLTNDTDPDGDALTASLVTAPVNGTVVLNADGSFTYTPNTNFNGLDSLQYQVCDNGAPSLCDSATVRFTVTPVNDAPTISGTPATSVNQDAAYSFTPTANDIDGDVLTFSIVNQPDWADFDAATGELSGTPGNGDVGTTAGIVITVSDGTLSDSLPAFDLEVVNVNDAPTISGTPATGVNQDATYSFTPIANDIDGDVLTFSIVNQPAWADFDPATGELGGTPGNSDVGVTTGIVIIVSDGMLSDSLPAFDLEVVNVNDAPTISGTPATGVNQDAAYSFIPTANDIDGDVLTFSIVNQPDWADFNTATGALTGTPDNDDVGVTTGIVISVSDGTLSASLPAFDLEVVNVNDVPTISGTPATTVNQDAVYSFTPIANDIDGDVLTFSIVNRPAWADFNTATGALTGTPGNSDVGVTTGIVITVSDGVLTASLPAFDLEVTTLSVTGVSLPGAGYVYDGTPKSLALAGTLPEGTTVAYTDNSRTDAGSQTVTATISGTGYTPLVLTATLTISKAQPVITAAAMQTHVYDGTEKTVTATVVPAGLAAQLQYSPQSSFTNVGGHRVRVYLNESANYLGAEAYTDFAVTPAGQQGLALADLTVTYNGNTHRLEVTGAASDAEVAYTINGQAGNSAVNAGSYEVTAVVSRANHADGTLTGTLYINRATAVITADQVQEHTFDGTAKAVQAALSHAETTLTHTPQQAYTAAGSYTVTVSAGETANYHAANATVMLRILPADQEGLSLPDRTVTYTGRAHSLSVQGLAEGATVTYTIDGEAGNSATDAGSYEVVAVVSRADHADGTLTGTLVIDRATAYILGEENRVHVYDGTARSPVAELSHGEGTLSYDPAGSFTDAGTYTITVSAGQSANYEAVSRTFTLRIDRAQVTGVSLEDTTHTYDGSAKTLSIDGDLPAGTAVSYTINGESGNSATAVGSYTVAATISGPNYQPLVLTAQLEITAAGVIGVTLEDVAYTYDGTAKSLAIDGDLPEGTVVAYTINGQVGNSATDAGTYTVTATVSGLGHATRILTATLTIGKAQPVITAAAMQSHVYDGTEKSVAATVVPEALADQLQYSPQRSFTNVGGHRVRVYLNESANYLGAEAYTDFAVTPAGQQGLALADLTVTYDGNAHRLEVTGASADAEVAYTINGQAGSSAVNAGSYEVVAVVSRANHADGTLAGTLYINKATAAITADTGQEHTYDGSAKTVEAALNHTETSLSFAPQQSYTAAGTYAVTVSAGETANYHAANATVTLRILPADQEGLSLPDRTVTYTGQAHSLSVQGLAEGATVTYTIDGEAGNSATDAGSYEVVAVVSRANHADGTLTGTLVIDRATAYILGEENRIHVYDGTARSLAVELSHGEGTLSYDPAGSFTDAGTYTITVEAEQSRNHAAVSKTFTLRIDRAPVTGIALDDATHTYDGTAKSLVIEGDLPAGTTVAYTINGEAGNSATAVGSYTVAATISGPNYQPLVLTAQLGITAAEVIDVTLEDVAYTYDGTARSLAIEGNVPNGTTVAYTINGTGGNSAINAGIYTVTAAVSGANHATRVLTATLTIGKAQPVITAAATQRHVYDGTEKSVAATVVPEALADQLQYSPQRSFTNVGEYRVRVYLNESANYLGAEAYTDVAVTPAGQQELALADLTVTYNGNTHQLEVTGAASDAEVAYTINGQLGNSAVNAGSYEVVAVVSRANHADETLTGTLYINKATAAITADTGQEHTYDGTAKTVKAALNHTETTLTFTPQAGYTAAGSYTVTVSAGETANYHAANATVTLRILPADQEGLSLPDRMVTYTGQVHSLSVQGMAEGATVVYTIDGEAGNSAVNAGSYEVVAVVSRANYADETLTGTLVIDRATAYILGEENRVHVYDGTARSLVAELSHGEGILSYDPAGSFTDAGTYTITVSAGQSANYEAVSKTFTLRIDRAVRTLDFPSLPAKTYGDGDFTAGATAGTGEAVIYTGSDPAVATVTGGTIRIVGAGTATITATVADNANYSNKPEVSRTLTVAKASQTITLSAPAEVNRDAGSVSVTATAGSGLPVSLGIDDPEVATLSGTALHIHRLGTVRITATQAGDGNHYAADTATVTVRVVDPSSDFPIRVSKAVSPNGDGINEYLIIEAIKDHPENRVRIFNRNGTVVYEASGYNNGTVAFRGIGTGQHRVPAGTYFYAAEIRVNGEWVYEKGWFVLRY